MDGPVLVVGDPHSNFEATRAKLWEAQRRGIPARRILCTGDVVAYGADARRTMAAVRDAARLVQPADVGAGWHRGRASPARLRCRSGAAKIAGSACPMDMPRCSRQAR
jgi:hypothetical protein